MHGRHAQRRSASAVWGSGARHAKPQYGGWLSAGCGVTLLGLVLVGQLLPEATLPEQNAAVQARLSPSVSALAALPPALTQSLDGAPLTASVGGPAPASLSAPSQGSGPWSAASFPGATRIPATALGSYLRAAEREALRSPSCHLPWALLAGIGLMESGHAWGHGSEQPAWDGTARPPIYGPVLDGNGFAAVPDSDGGAVDGTAGWDRAVGPMQFLPSTWLRWGVDADGDGRADPQDLSDAAAAAADYLCAGGRNLTVPADLVGAVYSYNHSLDYVRDVLSAARDYGTADVSALAAALAVLPPSSVVEPAPVAASVPVPVPVAAAAPSPLPVEPEVGSSPTAEGPRPSRSPAPSPSPSSLPTSKPSPSVTPGSTAQASPTPATQPAEASS